MLCKRRPVRETPASKRQHLRFTEFRPDNAGMALEFTTSYLKDSIEVLRYYKRLAERAITQAPDEALLAAPDAESNSIAVIVKHLAGNMRSRFTDFLASDGEKPDRKRDTEFETPPKTRAELMAMWEAGWQHVFSALTPLTDEHLSQKVYIRSEAHSVTQAINRQLAHYAYHIGQIVYQAFRGPQVDRAHHSSWQIRRVYEQSCFGQSFPALKLARVSVAKKSQNRVRPSSNRRQVAFG
jgi:hypothetical protein